MEVEEEDASAAAAAEEARIEAEQEATLEAEAAAAAERKVEEEEEEVNEAFKKVKYALFGNPGCWKTTLLNCFANEVLFLSGPPPDGAGVTQSTDVKEGKNGHDYVNIPGLSDVLLRRGKAGEITIALRLGGNFKIIFVIMEVEGRIREEDKTTLKLVLDAAPSIGSDYGVIVNRCDDYAWRQQRVPEFRKKFLGNLFRGVPSPSHHVSDDFYALITILIGCGHMKFL